MTDRTAAELAAEALRRYREIWKSTGDRWDGDEWTVTIGDIRMAMEALAALTAEVARVKNPRELTAHFGDPCIYCGIAHDDVAVGPCPARVSPDREALARRLTRLAVVCHAANIGIDGIPGDCLIADALAFIRAPAQAEVEAMAALADARSSDCHIKCTNESLPQWVRDVFKNHANNFSSIAVFLRRLPPAVGEWRPIATFDETDAGKFDFWLDWADNCVKMNPPLAETSWAGERLFRGYHRGWPSYLKATHWMSLPPAPPQETKP